MPKSKQRKDHSKKIAKRKEAMKQEKAKFQKMQHEMLMKLIEDEKKKGLYSTQVPQIPQIGPDFTSPNFEGPTI